MDLSIHFMCCLDVKFYGKKARNSVRTTLRSGVASGTAIWERVARAGCEHSPKQARYDPIAQRSVYC